MKTDQDVIELSEHEMAAVTGGDFSWTNVLIGIGIGLATDGLGLPGIIGGAIVGEAASNGMLNPDPNYVDCVGVTTNQQDAQAYADQIAANTIAAGYC